MRLAIHAATLGLPSSLDSTDDLQIVPLFPTRMLMTTCPLSVESCASASS